MMTVEDIAKIAHAANRAYAFYKMGEEKPKWEDAPAVVKNSVRNGVVAHLHDDNISPKSSHDMWLQLYREKGYVYGETIDHEAKTHPCMMEYDELPPEHRVKDVLFKNIVKSFKLYVDRIDVTFDPEL